MTQHWIAVASADHVRRGLKGGFMQVSHGKLAPLKKIAPGDRVAYYSPTEIYGNKDQFQSFTAIGTVREGEPRSGSVCLNRHSRFISGILPLVKPLREAVSG